MQVRCADQVNNDYVERYATAIKSGDNLPGMVATKLHDRIVIADGYHRYPSILQCGFRYVKGIYLF